MKQDKRNTFLLAGALLLFTAVSAWYLHTQWDMPDSTYPTGEYSIAEPELHGLYSVVRVVDGDTIVVDLDGTNTTVRLIGVDTPESVHPDKSRNTEEGKQASEWTANLLNGKQVYLEYDTERTDNYGRTLAYVWMEDGSMVQDLLLENGIAVTMKIQPNCKYAVHFAELERNAQEKVG